MGIVALPPSGTGEFLPFVELGVGPAELFVAAGLVYTFALIYLLDAAGLEARHERATRRAFVAAAGPLLFAFGTVVLYTSLTVL